MTEQAQQQPFWEALTLPPPGTPMTRAEFDALPEVHFYMELMDGVLIYPHWNEESPSPVPDHQDIVGNIYALLRGHARQHGGTAHIAPVDVVLGVNIVVQPDVLWRAPDSACIRTDKRFQGAPELVVEVLSPGTARRDRADKFAHYETHGVREYWIVDPRDTLVEVYTRNADRLERVGAFTENQSFRSPLLAQSFPVDAVFDV